MPDARVQVTCLDPATGEQETQELPPDSYILIVGERCKVTSEQHHANGTTQIVLKRGALRGDGT